MFSLIPNVLNRRVNLRLANGECGIAALPRKSFIFRGNGFYPSATIAFHLFNNVGNGLVFRKHQQYVYMVFSPAYTEHLTASCIDKRSDVCVHLWNMFFIYYRTRCFCVEDDVQVYFAKWLCHINYLLPFQGVVDCFVFLIPGRCPGLTYWWSFRPTLLDLSWTFMEGTIAQKGHWAASPGLHPGFYEPIQSAPWRWKRFAVVLLPLRGVGATFAILPRRCRWADISLAFQAVIICRDIHILLPHLCQKQRL